MRFVRLLFVTIISVSTVKSECDTYFECLGSFFDSFFGNYKNFKTDIEVRNITVPGFDTVNIDRENINNLLSGVSSFIQEELDDNVHFSPQLNIFKNIGNSTAIYVKSITINNSFGDRELNNTFKYIAPKEEIDQSVIHTSSTNNLNDTTPVPITSNITSSKEVLIDEKVEKNEIIDSDYPLRFYYDMDEDNNDTDYLKIDYLEMYKDTTNEYTDLKPTEMPIYVNKVSDYDIETKRPNAIMFGNMKNNSNDSVDDKCRNNTKNVTEAVFPWIAAIYVKNDTSGQFDYYCDGVLWSESVVITAARCMEYYGSKVDANNLLVLLGKSSLQSTSETERVVKVKSIIIHENFSTDATPVNDIAILLMEEVALNDYIQTACLGGEKGLQAVTTGWAISGELTIIPFDGDHNSNCKVSKGNNTFCAAYGNEVTVCPSYGGVFAVKQGNGWYLQGIRTGDPGDRGLCFDRSVYFTDLTNYVEWIDNNTSK